MPDTLFRIKNTPFFWVCIWTIGFTKDGRIKLFDFGLACIIDAASTSYDKTYQMSGETGSPRYMAPEVAQSKPYNQKVDVYSYGKSICKNSRRLISYINMLLLSICFFRCNSLGDDVKKETF